MRADPVETNPQHYAIVFENERVRVLEYRDEPGDAVTVPHSHPDSVMITMTDFSRRLTSGAQTRQLDLPASAVRWLPAQEHSGENIGQTPTHVFFVELKESSTHDSSPANPLGPEAGS